MSLFPSEDEQIAWITEAESYTPSAFSAFVMQEDVDHILRMEGNADHARMMIATEFSKGKSTEEMAEFLKSTFHGGNGIVTDNGRYSVWYAEDGIHIATDDAARYLFYAKVVSWQEAAERIGQLLEQGEYATNVELSEAPGHERMEFAKSLWYLRGDLSEEASKQGYLSCLDEYQRGGFPDATARLSEALQDTAFYQTLRDEFAAFSSAYSQDRSLMRFHFHKPQEIWTRLSELPLPRQEYRSDMAEIPFVGRFITEDEISASLTRRSGIEGGKGHIYAYFTEKHSSKEQADFLKNEYGIGSRSHAVSGATHSGEDHSGKGIVLKKQDCPDVQMNWANVAKRISEMIRKDRFLTPEEKTQYETLQRQNTERNAGWNEYDAVKEAHPDDMVLYQVGDFFEMYGEDARTAAELLDLNLTTRNIPDAGRVAMCGIPAHSLEQYVEDLRDKYDVTISAVDENSRERRTYTMPSIDHEAERATDVYEAEFGADGYRAFPGNRPEEEPTAPDVQAQLNKYLPIMKDAVEQDARYRNACGYPDRENAAIECNAAVRRAVLNSNDMELIRAFSDMPEFRERLHQEAFEGTYERLYEFLRPLSQDDIDDALRAWNGDIKSKHAVVRYMRDHARDKDTAAWLSREYGGDESKNLFISRAGNPDIVELTWAKVRRRISQLIDADDFYTDRERDNLDDVDPIAIREALAERGIVNGELVDPAALDRGPFIQQVKADAERIAQEEQEPALEQAKSLINDFCQSEYGDDADFSDLTKIGVAYNTVTDDEIPIQVNIDLVNYRLERYLDDEHLETRQYGSMQELIANELESLDFSELVYVSYEEVEQYRFHEPAAEEAETPFPYAVGDTVYLEDGKPFIIESIGSFDISLRDPTLFYPIFRAESKESFERLVERFPQPEKAAQEPVTEEAETAPDYHSETVAVYPAEETRLPYDVVIQTLHIDESEPPAQNFRITDDDLGVGGAKAKFRMNMAAIHLLKELEFEDLQASPEQQEILSRYVGWGGLADAFDESKDNWKAEFTELYAALSPEEYAAARASTLNAHYTSPTVIRAIYDAVENMGFQTGNILEPSMGVGNFFGMLPESMKSSRLYGVELDSITGRIAKQLYPKADITVAGFETTDRKDFFDLAVGNVPFGQYQVSDRAFDKLGFSIHNYFFAKALEQVRPGGVVAFVTSRYTMDAKDSAARKYIAQRADFLGAIRLPNNAFKANAGTDVVSDIIFLQKRDRPIEIEPDWVHTGIWRNPGANADGFAINRYFIDHPEMILGRQTSESTQYGRQDFTVAPIEGADLAEQLSGAIRNIRGTYAEAELPDLGEDETIVETIPADPNVRNFSYTVVDGELYYRQNSIMTKPDFNATAKGTTE